MEFQNLVHLNKSLSLSLRKTIPTPIILDAVDNNCFFIQTYMEGETISDEIRSYNIFGRKRFKHSLNLVKDWLLNFQNQTKKGDFVHTQEFVEEKFLNPFYAISKDYEFTLKEKEFFSSFQNKIKNIENLKIPIVSSHGDFFASNILLKDKNEINVIDWCDFEIETNPFIDLFTLVSTFRLAGRDNKENILRSLKYCFLEKNWFSVFLKAYIQDYLSAAGYNNEAVKIFYPLFLMDRVFREHTYSDILRTQYWREHFRLYIENEDLFLS